MSRHSQGDDFQAVFFQGQDHALRPWFRRAGQVKHNRNRGPIDIGIHQANPQSLPCKGQGNVDRHRGFADPALAAGHGHDLFDLGNPWVDRRRKDLLPLLPAQFRYLYPDMAYLGQGAKGRVDLFSKALAQGRALASQGQGQRDRVSCNSDVADESQVEK